MIENTPKPEEKSTEGYLDNAGGGVNELEGFFYYPNEYWNQVSERLKIINEMGNAIGEGMLLLKMDDKDRIKFSELSKKIIKIREIFYQNCESKIAPDKELYKDLEEVENELKSFKN